MPELLILCTANICRSPMVEGLTQFHLQAAGHSDWRVSSAGTWARDGSAASEFSLQLLAERGINLANHRSRAVTRSLLEQSDLVVVMTRNHKEAVQTEFPDQASKVYLISEMVGLSYDIADPIGMPIEEYRYTFAELEDIIKRGLPRIIELAARP